MLLDQSKFKERFDEIKKILGLTDVDCKKISPSTASRTRTAGHSSGRYSSAVAQSGMYSA